MRKRLDFQFILCKVALAITSIIMNQEMIQKWKPFFSLPRKLQDMWGKRVGNKMRVSMSPITFRKNVRSHKYLASQAWDFLHVLCWVICTPSQIILQLGGLAWSCHPRVNLSRCEMSQGTLDRGRYKKCDRKIWSNSGEHAIVSEETGLRAKIRTLYFLSTNL
jgi:hypothetical protein